MNQERDGRWAIIWTFVAVLGARWWLIAMHGSPIPFWDQWDAEALAVYLPWAESRLDVASLWAPHNEHLLILTHIENLALLILNGRWDPLAQMTLNAVWPSLAAAFVARLLIHSGTLSSVFAALTCVMAFAAPYGWQNTLWGFQSTPLLLLLFSTVAAYGFGHARPWSRSWWLGMLALWLIPLASAGGLAVIASLITALILTALVRARTWPEVAPALIGCGAVLVIALALRTEVPAHASLKASSFGEFMRAFGSSLAWPLVDQPWAALIMWSPICTLVGQIAIRGKIVAGTPTILILGLISVAHAAAIAFARGGGLNEGTPLSRYQDLLALGPIANLGAFAVLIRTPIRGQHHRNSRLLLGGWIGLATLGLVRLTYQNHAVNLAFKASADVAQMENLSRYISTHDPAVLADRGLYEISHSSSQRLRTVLEHPAMQPLLPRVLQTPIPPATRTERTVRFALASGVWLFVGGLGGLAARAAFQRFSQCSKRTEGS